MSLGYTSGEFRFPFRTVKVLPLWDNVRWALRGPGLSSGLVSAPSHKYLGIRAPLHPLPLRCASSPYSTVWLSRAPCWRGASPLSVRQAIYQTVHEPRFPDGSLVIRGGEPHFRRPDSRRLVS